VTQRLDAYITRAEIYLTGELDLSLAAYLLFPSPTSSAFRSYLSITIKSNDGDNRKQIILPVLMNVTHDYDRNDTRLVYPLLVNIAQDTTGRIHHVSDGDFRKHPVSWHDRIRLYKQTSQDESLSF